MTAARWQALLAGLWAGVLLTIALIATPAPFAVLGAADAGKVVARIFAQEAYLSLVAAMLLYFIERRRTAGVERPFTVNVGLLLGTLFCTVAGYFAIQPMLEAARAGQGPWSFGALHAASVAFFGVKGILVLILAWRLAPR
jgi:hypothetical protein